MVSPGPRNLGPELSDSRVHTTLGVNRPVKVDRLSRSLLDFAWMMETFEKHKVSFVSVTQQFNTANSMGRLVLHVLLSFAQFEREIISERTRDKIAAARRKGKWVGGMTILGFDVDSRGSKLAVNDDEAARVRAIFELDLEHRSLLAVIHELDARGWCNKRWTTRNKDEVHDGEDAAMLMPPCGSACRRSCSGTAGAAGPRSATSSEPC